MGAIISGFPTWARLPGPYLVSADSRSIEPEGITDATWARQFLGENNRFGADRINRILLLTYGHQWPLSLLNDHLDVSEIYLAPHLSKQEWDSVAWLGVRYMVVDRRLTTALPMVDVYFETDTGYTKPLAPELLDKFDHNPAMDRVMDSGNIAI